MIPNGTQLGKYRILCPLGAGGMGEVYRALDLQLDREVAVKVLPEKFADSAERLARFQREAKAVASLAHPNVLALHDFATEQGITFAVTELLEGETLRQRIEKSTIPWRKSLEIGAALAEGLAAAQAKNIVHRDIKPDNVFLTSDGRVKILDFGLARAEPEPQTETRPFVPGLTETGKVMGTVGYMSPEQIHGEPVDGRSDIFSFGCVLYEMLAGRRPFQRPTRADILSATVTEDPPEFDVGAEGMPAGAERLVRRCLEKKPEQRFQSARDLAFDLHVLLTDADKSRANVLPPPRRNLLPFWVITMALLLAVGITSRFVIWPPKESRLKRIAVLPIVNTNKEIENDWSGFSDEITGMLIERLQVRNLVVRPFFSVMTFKDPMPNFQEVGDELKVDYVLVGRLERGDKISVELVEMVDGGRPVLRKSYAFVGDKVYGDISKAVLETLEVPLTDEERQRIDTPLTDRNAALRLYLLGQREFKSLKLAQVTKAIEYYELALVEDSTYSLPHLGLAYAYYWQSGIYAAPKEVMPQAMKEAQRAIELNKSLAEAHSLLGLIMAIYEWDWDGAQKSFDRALELNPSSMNVQIYYATYLALRGEPDKALVELKKTQELDPLTPEIPGYSLLPLYFARSHDLAIKGLRAALKNDPNSVNLHSFLGLNLEAKGGEHVADAIEEFQEARKLDADNNNPETFAQLGHAYGLAGRKEEALNMLEELKGLPSNKFISSYNFAIVYVGLGQMDNAIDALESAADQQTDWFASLKVDPRLDPLRDDPRFKVLLRKANLSQ